MWTDEQTLIPKKTQHLNMILNTTSQDTYLYKHNLERRLTRVHLFRIKNIHLTKCAKKVINNNFIFAWNVLCSILFVRKKNAMFVNAAFWIKSILTLVYEYVEQSLLYPYNFNQAILCIETKLRRYSLNKFNGIAFCLF